MPTKEGGTAKTGLGGIQPEFGYVDPNTGYQREELSPYDVATIYNELPLWTQSSPITGKGVKVAIVALSDVVTSDFNTYRSSFGLPAGTLQTVHSGSDPGLTDSQGENTEDVEMVSATAPGATIVLVSDVDNGTTNGLVTAIDYIVNNEVAPILTMSYGTCELENGTSTNSLFNQIFQQAATLRHQFLCCFRRFRFRCLHATEWNSSVRGLLRAAGERHGLHSIRHCCRRNGPAMAVCRIHSPVHDVLEHDQ